MDSDATRFESAQEDRPLDEAELEGVAGGQQSHGSKDYTDPSNSDREGHRRP